jgi:hypothetical protein
MSRLYLNERGRVIRTLCEELTVYRRARKLLHLAATDKPADLHVFARAYPESDHPLLISVNGKELAPVSAQGDDYYWYTIPLEPTSLKEGVNRFEFWTEATAMNAWSLAMEPGHLNPQSFVSGDNGCTWQNHHMGYLNALTGEYIVRIRLTEGNDPAAPTMAWEDPTNPRLNSLREIIPSAARHREDRLLDRVRALSSWISSSWEHTDVMPPTQYTPWDAETILAWGGTKKGHGGHRPIAMCVHFGVTFVSCCQALGIPARCAVLLGTPSGCDGHFVAEVWFEEYAKWVMVDANIDAICWKENEPLSISEIQDLKEDLGKHIEWGSGYQFQRRFPHMVQFVEENMNQGLCFRHRGLWPRADFLTHPEQSPPGHGAQVYCESDIVWEERDREEGFGMFPYFADRDTFERAPSGLPGYDQL